MLEKWLSKHGFVREDELSQAKYDVKFLAAQLDRERVNRARDRDSWAADVGRMTSQYAALLDEHKKCSRSDWAEAVLAAARLAEVRERSLAVAS